MAKSLFAIRIVGTDIFMAKNDSWAGLQFREREVLGNKMKTFVHRSVAQKDADFAMRVSNTPAGDSSFVTGYGYYQIHSNDKTCKRFTGNPKHSYFSRDDQLMPTELKKLELEVVEIRQTFEVL